MPATCDGDDALIGGGLRLLESAEHDGDVGAVDVGVHEADFVAQLDEGESEVDGDGGFADAAFAAGDGDEILYAGDWMAFGLLHWGWGHGVLRSLRNENWDSFWLLAVRLVYSVLVREWCDKSVDNVVLEGDECKQKHGNPESAR